MMTGVGLSIDALQKATPIVSGFLLGYVAVLPLIGRIADLVARQRVLVACLAVFVVGSAVTALAVELPVLVAGRVLQGVGGGGLVPATLALVADLWPPGRRGMPLGVVGAVQELGSVLGPVFGAAVLAVSGWRTIFWLNAVAGLVLAVVVTALGGRPLPRPRGIPLVLGGLALVAGALALDAPDRLATDVTLGLPFVPFGTSTSRLATPIGVVALVLLVLWLAVTAPRAWPTAAPGGPARRAAPRRRAGVRGGDVRRERPPATGRRTGGVAAPAPGRGRARRLPVEAPDGRLTPGRQRGRPQPRRRRPGRERARRRRAGRRRRRRAGARAAHLHLQRDGRRLRAGAVPGRRAARRPARRLVAAAAGRRAGRPDRVGRRGRGAAPDEPLG